MKTCTKCGTTKEKDMFCTHGHICLDCKYRAAEYRDNRKHTEAYKKYMREYARKRYYEGKAA